MRKGVVTPLAAVMNWPDVGPGKNVSGARLANPASVGRSLGLGAHIVITPMIGRTNVARINGKRRLATGGHGKARGPRKLGRQAEKGGGCRIPLRSIDIDIEGRAARDLTGPTPPLAD